MKKCPICCGKAHDNHFGSTVYVCRACSAFFRRYVLSTKSKIVCKNDGNCEIDYKQAKNCRFCRMEKCRKIGMKNTAVQGPRDSHKNTQLPSILPRLSLLQKNYSELQRTRRRVFGKSKTPRYLNIHEMDDVIREDVKHVEKFMKNSYPELNDGFEKSEIFSLFANYYIKNVNFEPPFRGVLEGTSELVLPNGDYYEKDVEKYYTDKIKATSNMSKECIKSFFQQYWDVYNRTVVRDVHLLKFDLIEFLAISSLIFWDTLIDDFSENCFEKCRKMRTEIFSEMGIYYRNVKKLPDPCYRLGQVVLFLASIERSFSMCQEELEMFGVVDKHDQQYSWTTSKHRARRLAAIGHK